MNLTNRLGSTTAGTRSVALALPRPSRAVARAATIALLATLIFVVAGTVGLALYASSHAGRIYEGVAVAGLDLGGLTPQEAQAALDERFASYAKTPLPLSAGGKTFQLTPAEAGARLDSAATIDAALSWGRQGSFWEQSRAWARALLRGAAISPVIVFDQQEAQRRIAAFAPQIVKPAVDATLTYDQRGQPQVVPDTTGVRLDYAATTSLLKDRITAFASDPVPLITHDDPATVTAASLAATLPTVSAAVDKPLVISGGGSVWHVPVAALQSLFRLDPATAKLTVDQRPIASLVESLAAEVNRNAVDAGITVDENGRLAVVPQVNAAAVDVDASVKAIADGLLAGNNEVALVVKESPPQILDAMAAAAVKRGEALLTPGITVTWNGGEGKLDRADLLRALTIRSRPGNEEPFVFGLDPNQVWNSLFRYAAEFDIPVQNARWRLIDGKIQLAVPESKGRALDLETGVASVMAAFLDHKTEVTLNVRTILPRWTAKDGAAITLGNDVLGEGGTWYGDSSEARRNNVEIGSSLASGWLVPPGATFSFADSVGLITEEKGFVTGYGIVDDGGGGFTTAPVIGGGICQVSTTLFQAIFWAGLPVTERYQHPYYLRNYGEAASGLPGLDAMVNIESDWRLDLKFKNTTGYWLAVVMIPDGQMVYARILGTDPGWNVEVPEPTITNEVKADDSIRYTESPELPAGTERMVEQAQDGFDVRVDRTVRKGNRIILQDSFSSSFAPQRNTIMRGTGTGDG